MVLRRKGNNVSRLDSTRLELFELIINLYESKHTFKYTECLSKFSISFHTFDLKYLR